MGQISVSITKRTAFRDSVQHFSNVYTYGSLLPNVDAYGQGDVIIDKIVAQEKLLHSTAVTFVHARMWSSGGSKEENTMLYEKALTGTGSGAYTTGFDKERAILAQWRAGTDSRGRPVYLRKWYHVCGGIVTNLAATAVMENATALASAVRTQLAGMVEPLNRVGGSLEWGLIAPSGRERDDSGPPVIHPYLEHHQLGDEWRG